MNKRLLLLPVLAAGLCLAGESPSAVTVTDVCAKQRWPWNNLVDVDFNLMGAEGEKYLVNIDAQCAGGTKKFSAATFATDPVVSPGANRVTWDFGKDYPGIRAEDMSFAVSVTPQSGTMQPLYLYIDLSAGSTASSYPVRYTNVGPAHVQGAIDEPCQTTQLWMRRINVPAAAFPYTKYNGFWCNVTKDYYVSVFELTQKQYQMIVGAWPNSFYTNEVVRASRPVEGVSFDTFTGGYPTGEDDAARTITDDSPLGKLRNRSKLALELPTRAQWELAGRGGTYLTSKNEFWSYHVNGKTVALDTIARYGKSSKDKNADASVGTAPVGSYVPNDYGLYDIIGNVAEYIRDRGYTGDLQQHYKDYADDQRLGDAPENPVPDPCGVKREHAASDWKWLPVGKGGQWSSSADYCNLWTIQSYWSSEVNSGYRLVVEVE